MQITQAGVVEPQLMQERGQQAWATDPVLDGLVAELIRRAVDVARSEAATCQQQREAMTVILEDGDLVVIQPAAPLKPLPELEGFVPEGWKDAIY